MKSSNDSSEERTPFDELTSEVSRLEGLIEKQIDQLTAMRTKTPYCYDLLLQDDEWIEKKQNSLKTSIAANHEECCRLEAALKFLLQTNPGRLH